MGPATGSLASIPHPIPFSFTKEAAILTAKIPTNVLAAAAAAATVRTHKMAEFTTAAGSEAHAAAIKVGATEEEATLAAQAAAEATLAAAKTAVAEADATTSTT